MSLLLIMVRQKDADHRCELMMNACESSDPPSFNVEPSRAYVRPLERLPVHYVWRLCMKALYILRGPSLFSSTFTSWCVPLSQPVTPLRACPQGGGASPRGDSAEETRSLHSYDMKSSRLTLPLVLVHVIFWLHIMCVNRRS